MRLDAGPVALPAPVQPVASAGCPRTGTGSAGRDIAHPLPLADRVKIPTTSSSSTGFRVSLSCYTHSFTGEWGRDLEGKDDSLSFILELSP